VAHSCYLDASALVKRYIPEKGTPVINYLFGRVPRDRMICLTLGTLEVISILVRRRNANLLSLPLFHQALTDFRSETINAADVMKIPALDPLVNAAAPLVLHYSINSTDAVLLRSALDLASQLRASGSDLVLVTSDQRLLRAAQAEGVLTFDPEGQNQADLDAVLGP
jgi:predicted nucleic acid-binding protein